jgi:aerobic-type carbon monoxide dehydrogenase small subunit (CoxS/CutS family)
MIGRGEKWELLRRIDGARGKAVEITIDGEAVGAFESDTVLLAVLSRRPSLGSNDFDGGARAGFCLMGACQDCWVWLENGARVRACTTFVCSGMVVLTRGPQAGGAA